MGRQLRGIEQRGHSIVINLCEHPELLEKGGALSLANEGVLVIRGKKKLRAFSMACPHRPKNQVQLVDPTKKRCFRCKAHNWTWDNKGRPRGKAKEPLQQLHLRVVEHEVLVDIR